MGSNGGYFLAPKERGWVSTVRTQAYKIDINRGEKQITEGELALTSAGR